MSIKKYEKSKIIQQIARKDNDTGSPEVQCAILTERIKNLTEHFKNNPKDSQSRVGLIAMVIKRRRLLEYLKRIDCKRYDGLIVTLGIRK